MTNSTNNTRRAPRNTAMNTPEPRRFNSNVRGPITEQFLRNNAPDFDTLDVFARMAAPDDADREAALTMDRETVEAGVRLMMDTLASIHGGTEMAKYSLSRMVSSLVGDAGSLAERYQDRVAEVREAAELVESMGDDDARAIAGIEGAYQRSKKSAGFMGARACIARLIAEQAIEYLKVQTGEVWKPLAGATSGVALTKGAVAADMAIFGKKAG